MSKGLFYFLAQRRLSHFSHFLFLLLPASSTRLVVAFFQPRRNFSVGGSKDASFSGDGLTCSPVLRRFGITRRSLAPSPRPPPPSSLYPIRCLTLSGGQYILSHFLICFL